MGEWLGIQNFAGLSLGAAIANRTPEGLEGIIDGKTKLAPEPLGHGGKGAFADSILPADCDVEVGPFVYCHRNAVCHQTRLTTQPFVQVVVVAGGSVGGIGSTSAIVGTLVNFPMQNRVSTTALTVRFLENYDFLYAVRSCVG